jgi:hypothetical protein
LRDIFPKKIACVKQEHKKNKIQDTPEYEFIYGGNTEHYHVHQEEYIKGGSRVTIVEIKIEDEDRVSQTAEQIVSKFIIVIDPE